MEHIVITIATAIVAFFITLVANTGFDQAWGLAHWLVIWVILLVVSYGGFLIIDDDIF